VLFLPPHVLTYSTYIWNKQTQINLKIYWLLTEVLTKMENREIVMLVISIETKELCCRNSKDCLLYRIYLYVLDNINTAILSECSPFREGGGGLWITDCKRFNVKFIPFICVFACVEWITPNSWKEIKMMHEFLYRSIEKKKVLITNKTAQEKLKY